MVAVLLKSCSQASIHLCTYDVCGANGGLPCCSNSRVCNLQAYGAMRSRRVSIWSRAMWRGQPESPPFSPRARRTPASPDVSLRFTSYRWPRARLRKFCPIRLRPATCGRNGNRFASNTSMTPRASQNRRLSAWLISTAGSCLTWRTSREGGSVLAITPFGDGLGASGCAGPADRRRPSRQRTGPVSSEDGAAGTARARVAQTGAAPGDADTGRRL